MPPSSLSAIYTSTRSPLTSDMQQQKRRQNHPHVSVFDGRWRATGRRRDESEEKEKKKDTQKEEEKKEEMMNHEQEDGSQKSDGDLFLPKCLIGWKDGDVTEKAHEMMIG